MASSSKTHKDVINLVVKEEPDDWGEVRLFGEGDEHSVEIPLNHPAEAVRRRLAHRMTDRSRINAIRTVNKPFTRGDKLKLRLGGPVWDLSADSTIILGLETYYYLNSVEDIHGLIDAIVFVGNFFAFVEKPIPWLDIWLRLQDLRKRFLKFEEFIRSPGIKFDETTGQISVTSQYKQFVNKESTAHQFYRRFGLPDYKSYKFVFSASNVSALLDGVRGTWYETFGATKNPAVAPDFLI